MRPLSIHVVKHAMVGDAEEVLVEIATARGHAAEIVDPRERVLSLDVQVAPDVVIGRYELDSFTDPALSAYLAHGDWCAAAGAAVVNSLDFLGLCQDKFRTHVAVCRHLRSLGIEDTISPETLACFGRGRARELGLKILGRHGAVVIKRPCSGRGEGVFVAGDPRALDELLELELGEELLVLQQPIDKETNARGGFRDFRVLACRRGAGRVEVAAAYHRNGAPGEFKTNGSHGGGISRAEPLDPDLVRWSRLVMDALGGDVAGLDFARDRSGRLWLMEVNIAFETLRRSSLTLFGDAIWQWTVDLAESRAYSRPSTGW